MRRSTRRSRRSQKVGNKLRRSNYKKRGGAHSSNEWDEVYLGPVDLSQPRERRKLSFADEKGYPLELWDQKPNRGRRSPPTPKFQTVDSYLTKEEQEQFKRKGHELYEIWMHAKSVKESLELRKRMKNLQDEKNLLAESRAKEAMEQSQWEHDLKSGKLEDDWVVYGRSPGGKLTKRVEREAVVKPEGWVPWASSKARSIVKGLGDLSLGGKSGGSRKNKRSQRHKRKIHKGGLGRENIISLWLKWIKNKNINIHNISPSEYNKELVKFLKHYNINIGDLNAGETASLAQPIQKS